MAFDFDISQMPLVGNFFDNPGHAASQKTWEQTAKAYQAYRPEIAQARMKTLNSQLSMFAPVNAALGQMYGQGAQFDTSAAQQSPLNNRMMDMGAPQGAQLLNPQEEALRQYKADNEKALMKDRIFKTNNAPPPPGSEQLGGQRQAVSNKVTYAPSKAR